MKLTGPWRLVSRLVPATKHDIAILETNIMSAVSEFADKVTAHQGKIDAAVAGLAEDISSLKDQITELQNSPGGITPEDQALLDAIEAKAGEAAAKLDALNALTPEAPAPPSE